MKKNLLFGLLLMVGSVVFATAPTITNPFFENVSYRGAFGETNWTATWSNFDPQNTVYPATTVTIPAGNLSTTTWTKNNVYLLNGWVRIPDGVTLTIEAGTVIRGDKSSKAALIVERGGMLIANGTASEPIVFTSNQPIGNRASGDWGGVIICGKAATNATAEPTIEGGVLSKYGPTSAPYNSIANNNDNSGSLQYVRIEFPGVIFAANNEINGLTMGGVGSGTTLDYIQVSYSGDDSFEWFGGTVNAKHLIAFRGLDDDFDTDYGYEGMVQFGVSLRDPDFADVAGKSNCFESDNDKDGTMNTPFTTALFANISSYGPKATTTSPCSSFYQAAINVKANTRLQLYNSELLGWTNAMLVGGGAKTLPATDAQKNMVSNEIKVRNCYFSGTSSGTFAVEAYTTWTPYASMLGWLSDASFGNTIDYNNANANVNPVAFTNTMWDKTINNLFFNKVSYRGAFGTTDWTTGWSNFNPQTTNYSAATVTIQAGVITTNTTWTKNNVYLLNGYVYVADGATLTIEAGTIIRGDKNSKGSLIVKKGGKLIANGTVSEPIVFTSNQQPGFRGAGDWGGVILCGKAPINVSGGSAIIEGGVGSDITYGGTDPMDNSGSLKYVRIEFPGIVYTSNNEINGLTMGGVGSGTTIDYVQVSYSNDDSYEWFGGTVNAKHLIALAGVDDDFDTDFGYSGMVQFGVSLRDPAIADGGSGTTKSNCFESDNDATGTNNTPFTTAIFSNISSFGPKVTTSTVIHPSYQAAINFKSNTKLQVYNSVFAGWVNGIKVGAQNTADNMINNDVKVRNCILSGTSGTQLTYSNWTSPTTITDWYNTAAFSNTTVADNTSLDVTNPFSLTAPNFLPKSTSMLKSLSTWSTNVGVMYAYTEPIVARVFVNGSQLTAAGSKLSVIKNGVLYGSATIGSNNLFSLTAGYTTKTGSDFELELFDGATQKSYLLPTTFNFDYASSFGTVGAPENLYATASLTIPVKPNAYTWLSFNVLPENNSIANVLNYNVQDGDEIFGQGISANYDGGWDGIEFIEKNRMYVLRSRSQNPGSIVINNQILTKNIPVTIKNGFTWLGYSLVNSADANAALSGMAINNGTELYGQGESDSYDSGWEGLQLYPGRGYKIKTTSPQSTFNYPSKLGSIARVPSNLQKNSAAPNWVTPDNLQNYINCYGKVYKDGVLFEPQGGLVLAAFKDGVCRGTVSVPTKADKNVYRLTYGSNSATEAGYVLKVYVPSTDTYYTADTVISFSDTSIGSTSQPVRIPISTTSVKEIVVKETFNVYPNPVNDVFQLVINSNSSTNAKVDLYDLQGKLIQTIYSGVVNANNVVKVNRDKSISKGMYMLKATIGSKQFNTKVILK